MTAWAFCVLLSGTHFPLPAGSHELGLASRGTAEETCGDRQGDRTGTTPPCRRRDQPEAAQGAEASSQGRDRASVSSGLTPDDADPAERGGVPCSRPRCAGNQEPPGRSHGIFLISPAAARTIINRSGASRKAAPPGLRTVAVPDARVWPDRQAF